MTITEDNIVMCPKCGAMLDKATLYKMDCICMECGHFIDFDEEEIDMEGWEQSRNFFNFDEDDYWDNYDYEKDEYYLESLKRNNKGKGSEDQMSFLPSLKDDDEEVIDQIGTFVMRFVTDADYETVKASFERLDADIDYMELLSEGIIKKFLKEKGGIKLAQGLNLDTSKLEEYVVVGSFMFGDKDDSKKILISTLCQSFPLFIIREEESSYIMANNKGLAKGIIELTNGDEIELLSLFLTGFEKYLILSHFLYWCDPYKLKQAKDIMIKWDNDNLITLEAIRHQKNIPVIWQEYLVGLQDIKVSADSDDNGKDISFEQMLEDVVANLTSKKKIDGEKNIINVISLRGMGEYSIYEMEDDEDGTES